MRVGILILVLIATLFGSGYWYSLIDTVCNTPVHYRIGAVDERFNTKKSEMVRIAKNAEAVWESPLGQNLFIYDENVSSFPINLVFDERQKKADLEAQMKEDLNAKQGMSESVSHQYEILIGEFRDLKQEYEARVVSYQTKLATYNDTVTEWNKKGGAPQSTIDELKVAQNELTTEQRELESRAKKLNDLTAQLNAIGAKGNSLITDYNTVVKKYNDQFAEAHEFTQGEHTSTAINIYQFNSEDELTIVLAHEFGHALSLGHVENPKSIMYHLMGKQTLKQGITEEDTKEFERVCVERSPESKFFRYIGSFVKSLLNHTG